MTINCAVGRNDDGAEMLEPCAVPLCWQFPLCRVSEAMSALTVVNGSVRVRLTWLLLRFSQVCEHAERF